MNETMEWKDIEPKVMGLRNNITAAIAETERLINKEEKLAKPSASFDIAKKLVSNTEFDVVVCGEVKKGKSSLLNAIIGQEILPVNSNVATSQVFRITNCESESFALVFTDGSTMPIAKGDLSKYGSQVDANLHGTPEFSGRTLKYIQVNVPISFLPKGVSLVDTPGLGALYKSHEYITQNYVSKASAVIFVLDPDNPLVDAEEVFINKVLDVTPYMMFVMTKTDTKSSEIVSAQIKRDEELLQKIYEKRNLVAPHIYPMSSTELMSATTGRLAALKKGAVGRSNYPLVQLRLMMLIYRAVGLLRSGMAIQELAAVANKNNATIVELLNASNPNNQSELAEYEKKQTLLKTKMEDEWGAVSKKRKEVLNQVIDTCNSITGKIQHMISAVRREYDSKIESLTTMDEVRSFAETMPREIVNDVSSQWESIANDIQNRVTSIICQVGAQIEKESYGSVYGNTSGLDVKTLSLDQTISCFRQSFFNASWVTGLGGGILLTLGVVSLPVIAPIAAVAAAIWGFFGGNNDKEKKQVEQNKAAFRKELGKMMDQITSELLYIGGSSTRSMAAEFTNGMRQSAEEALQSICETQYQQIKEQIEELKLQAQQNRQKKLEEQQHWASVKAEWDKLTCDIKTVIAQRKELITLLK